MSFPTMPGYRRAIVTSGRTGAVPRRGDLPARFVGHTTEVTTRFSDYPWPPQTTVAWGGGHGMVPGTHTIPWQVDGSAKVTIGEGEVLKFQHCPIDRTGYALVGASSSGVETNHAGHCLQVEFLSHARYGGILHPWELEIIAEVIVEQARALFLATGQWIDLSDIVRFYGSAAYGTSGVGRMTPDEWYGFNGICAHQNVPGNSHWDWGAVDRAQLATAIESQEESQEAGMRLAGKDRIETQIKTSQLGWPDGSDGVVIANAFSAPDLAAGSSIGARLGWPLLSTAADRLDPRVRDEIRRLGAPPGNTRLVIGGTAAVSATTYNAVQSA